MQQTDSIFVPTLASQQGQVDKRKTVQNNSQSTLLEKAGRRSIQGPRVLGSREEEAGSDLMILCDAAIVLDTSSLSLSIELIVQHAQKVGSPHAHSSTHELHKNTCSMYKQSDTKSRCIHWRVQRFDQGQELRNNELRG